MQTLKTYKVKPSLRASEAAQIT